jgi:large conductance mechanosensitive channel
MLKTLQGFKDFILRGNVIDLAVGIVIGAAFTALVTSFTSSFIEPLIKLPGGGLGDTAGAWELGGQRFLWARFLNGLITFVLTAAVLYFFVVLPMNRLAQRRKEGKEPEPQAPSEEVRLLTEIRDALRGGSEPKGRPEPEVSEP